MELTTLQKQILKAIPNMIEFSSRWKNQTEYTFIFIPTIATLRYLMIKLKNMANNNKYKYKVTTHEDYVYIEFTKTIDFLEVDDVNIMIETIRGMNLSCDEWSMDMDDKEMSFGVDIQTEQLTLENETK